MIISLELTWNSKVFIQQVNSRKYHIFGIRIFQGTEERNHDLVQVYKNYFERRVNPTNLALLIDSYVRRTDLNITRELDPTRKKEGLTLGVPVMNITGALSPHVDDTVTLNGRLDPMNSSWMKVRNSWNINQKL